MRRYRQTAVRSLPALLLVASGACASSGQYQSPRRQHSQALQYWQQIRDSVSAQAIADEQGPRVTVRANFTSYGDSRRIEAYFNMKDDAYVMVGHLDALGVVRVMFPASPDDDGFVRGGKSYRTPNMFAGFESEYAWQRTMNYRYASHARSRYDSYDGGTGYVFVVASWRPMRLDRISDGDKWSSFELIEANVGQDPRPAIEELATLIAADNREAYTVAFAKYYRTNWGSMSYAALNRASCSSFGAYGYGNAYGYGYYGFSPFGAFGFGWPYFGYDNSGCGRSRWYGYGAGWYGFPVFIPVQPQQPPAIRPQPPGRLVPKPHTTGDQPDSIGSRPRIAEESAAENRRAQLNADRVTPPRPTTRPADEFRRRGLIVTEDAPENTARRSTPRAAPPPRAIERPGMERPGIVDMVGRRDETIDPRGARERYGQPRNPRESVREYPRPAQDNGRGFRPPRESGAEPGHAAPRGNPDPPRMAPPSSPPPEVSRPSPPPAQPSSPPSQPPGKRPSEP